MSVRAEDRGYEKKDNDDDDNGDNVHVFAVAMETGCSGRVFMFMGMSYGKVKVWGVVRGGTG